MGCSSPHSFRSLYVSENSSQAKTEKELYGPFVDSCNRALDLLDTPTENKLFMGTSELNCRFHVNDPKIITTDYSESSVHCKPDAVVTSTLAANDLQSQAKYNEAPEQNFKMHQIFSAIEFKKRKGELSTPLDRYTNKTRQCVYETDDKDLSELFPIDDHSTSIIDVNPGEPPQKRPKTDVSEQTGTLSATRSVASNKASGSRSKKNATRSRQGTQSKDETTHYAPNNSKKMIDARTQCGLYGMEMLSYATGVHRAITVLIIG